MNAAQLRKLLQRPIAFHRVFVEIAGGVTGGVFLSQLFYWHDKGEDPDGWIYKTQLEWQAETGLSRYEQERARAVLREKGLLEEERRGQPAKLYYRLDIGRLAASCLEHEERSAAAAGASDDGPPERCSPETRRRVLQLSRGRCSVCGVAEWEADAAMHMHRIVKGRDGGRYEVGNIIPVCGPCHQRVEGKTRHEIEELAEARLPR